MRMHTWGACAAASLLAATPALADVIVKDTSWNDRPSVEVFYNDLDLDSMGGIDTLNNRLTMAAKTVCGDVYIRNLREISDIRHCRGIALERAYEDRDAMLAARIAARDDPERLAALDTVSLSVRR